MQQIRSRYFKLIILSVVGSLLSLLFVFLGTPLLRVLRNVYGSRWYWLIGGFVSALLVAAGLMPIGLFLASVWMVIGLYAEFEERGGAGFYAGLLSVSLGTVLVILVPLLWFTGTGIDFMAELTKSLDAWLIQVQQSGPTTSWLSGVQIDSKLIISQIPSIIFIVHSLGLAFALMMDRRTAYIAGLPFEKVASQLRLLEFRLPDYMIWLAMFSFLLSFIKAEPQQISLVAMNVFSILMALYLLQGLAVLEVTLMVFRVSSFFRLLIYIGVVGQLFFLLSAVGVLDYWIDFRRRLRIARRPGGNQNNGERV